MLPEVEKLLRVQHHDQKLKSIEKELADIPLEEEDIKDRLTADQEALDQAKTDLQHVEVAIKNLELDVETRRDSIVKLKNQQFETKKNEEFQRMGQEIERYEAEISELEDKEIELMEQAEEQRNALSAAREKFEENEKSVAEEGQKAPAEAESKPTEVKEEAVAGKAAAEETGEIALVNGKDLGDWKKTEYGGEGEVFVDEEGNLEFGFGAVLTGVHWGKEAPAKSNYEISLEAMKLDGYDFFCALTFPVKESHATFVIGGWGGGVVGISSVDDLNASENETMNSEGFENNRWYKVRVRVTDDKIDAWLDEDHMVDLPLKDRKISLLPGDIELSVPIGLASYQTRSQYRNIVWKDLSASE